MSRSRECVGGVLALFGGLALLGMTFSGQCSRSALAIEEEPFLNEVFDPVESPLGWKVDGCESVPDGRVMLRYSPLGDATPEFVADEQEAEALSNMPKRMGKMQIKNLILVTIRIVLLTAPAFSPSLSQSLYVLVAHSTSIQRN